MIDKAVAASAVLVRVAIEGAGREHPVRMTLRGLWYRFRPQDDTEMLRELGFTVEDIAALRSDSDEG